MSNSLLFSKRSKVFLNYKFLTYKFRLLKFLGKFIPYFKPMTEFTEDDIIREFNHIITRHFRIYNNTDFTFTYFDSEDFSYTNKSCEILYKVVYKRLVNFNLSIKVRNKKAFVRFSDVKNISSIENAITDIFMFIEYFQNIEDIDFFKVYMDYVKGK